MENIEIIKTDNPNIVIVRTNIDKTMDVGSLESEKNILLNNKTELSLQLQELQGIEIPSILKDISDEKINRIISDIESINFQVQEINKILQKIWQNQ